jgi:hypothetical protein
VLPVLGIARQVTGPENAEGRPGRAAAGEYGGDHGGAGGGWKLTLSYDQWAQELLYLRGYFADELMDPCNGDTRKQDELIFYLSVIDARLTLIEPQLTPDSEVSNLVRQVQVLYCTDAIPDSPAAWTGSRPPDPPTVT